MRVDTDDFARPCGCGKNHHVEVKEILIEEGAVEKLEETMSDGFLKKYISPLLICDTNTCKVTEDIMEDIYDRCQVLVLTLRSSMRISMRSRSWRIIWKKILT